MKHKSTPTQLERILPDDKILVSKTDTKGIITYANPVFLDISGYTESELLGQPQNIVRHPDMPQVLFKIVWEHIKDRENVMALVKNLAKDGRYYWILTDFVTKVDADRNIISYTAYRRPVCKEVQEAISPLYKVLCAIEALDGMEASEKFLMDYFDRKKITYDEMVEDIIIMHCKKAAALGFGNQQDEDFKTMTEEKKQSFFKKFFGIK